MLGRFRHHFSIAYNVQHYNDFNRSMQVAKLWSFDDVILATRLYLFA